MLRSSTRQGPRAVQFAPDVDIAAEDDAPLKRSRIGRSRSNGDSQKTLTQIAFVRQDSDLSTTSGSRKRKRRTPSGSGKAQTTITQMPLVRSFNSMSEVVDHLGYGSHTSDDESRDDEVPQAPPIAKSIRSTAPIPDSEDEGEDFDLYIEEQVITAPGSPLRTFSVASSPPPNTNIIEDSTEEQQRSTASAQRCEERVKTPERVHAIASSQSPVLTPLSGKRGRLFESAENASRSPSMGRPMVGGSRSPAPNISHLRRSPRNPLQQLTASQNNILTSSDKHQMKRVPVQPIENVGKAARRSVTTKQRPRFIASSTKVSSLSSLGCEDDDETDSDNETVRHLDRLSPELSGSPLPAASQELAEGLDKMSDTGSIDKNDVIDRRQSIPEATGDIYERRDRLRSGIPDSQDEASAQLLLETQARFGRNDDIAAVQISRSSHDDPPSSIPAIRPSQATTVGTSPARSTQRFVRFGEATDDSMPPPMPSSPISPTKTRMTCPITSFDTDTTINRGNSSPSLHRPSSIGFESSPVLQQSSSRFAPCDESQPFSMVQIPPSYLGESIPPPPLWSDE